MLLAQGFHDHPPLAQGKVSLRGRMVAANGSLTRPTREATTLPEVTSPLGVAAHGGLHEQIFVDQKFLSIRKNSKRKVNIFRLI